MSEEHSAASADEGAAADGIVLRSRELAELAGTTPRALRHYHQIGLLPEAPRDRNGYRRYSVNDLVRVLRIRQLAAAGLPLRRIGTVMEHDGQSYEELLLELDRQLADQAQQIAVQRRMLADLRRLSVDHARFGGSHNGTTTQAVDRDVWTLATASGGIDVSTAETITDALHDPTIIEQAAAWYSEFEQLEDQDHIDSVSADRLAQHIAEFAETVRQTASVTANAETLPVMEMVRHMQNEFLSSAQQDVWARFLKLIEAQ